MFEVGLSITFHASHSLKGNFGPACEVHSHDYRVDVRVYGDHLSEEGVLLDITEIERCLRSITHTWDGTCLDGIDGLRGLNTTVEALSRHVHERLAQELRDLEGKTLGVTVWESPVAWGAYRAPIQASPADAAEADAPRA